MMNRKKCILNIEKLRERLEAELIRANTVLDEEVRNFLKNYDGFFSGILWENACIAKELGLPLCQDTGIVEFFVLINERIGSSINLCDLHGVLIESVEKVYSENPFRYSIIYDPLFDRKNTMSNSPPIVHFLTTEGKSEIRLLIKGGGSENLSILFMLNPTASVDEMIEKIVKHIDENGSRACPPLHVGIGIGGTSEKAMLLSKLALTKRLSERNPNEKYAKLELEMMKRINSLGIGYQGLGNGITVYSVHIEFFPTHIATLPVAVSVDCYLCRKGRIDLEDIVIFQDDV